MELPDLYEFPRGHLPSPDGRKLFIMNEGKGTLPAGMTIRLIGWIERDVYTHGIVASECIEILIKALEHGIFHDGYRGIHTCTLCIKSQPRVNWEGKSIQLLGHGHYLIQHGSFVYMAPSLLLHYIIDHNYKPPEEFIEAVLHGKVLTLEDLFIEWTSMPTYCTVGLANGIS